MFRYRKMQPIDTVLYCLYCCAVDYKTEDYECCIFEQETLNFTTILPCVLCMYPTYYVCTQHIMYVPNILYMHSYPFPLLW